MARSLRRNDIDNYDGTLVPGYYQRTHLNNIINNFTVAYVGQDKALTSVPRHEIAYWAQRAVQEFSYDVLHSEKSLEFELSEQKTLLLPPDYVNMKKITYTDENGNLRDCKRTSQTGPTRAVIQDENYEPVFDENGDIITGEESETTQRFKEHRYNDQRRFANQSFGTAVDSDYYYTGYFYGSDFSYFDYKRFGLRTELANYRFTYMLDNEVGIIYFGLDFKKDDIVTLHYISDGLADGDNLDNVYVPKLAEDAIYADILYNLSKLRPALAPAIPLYKKEAMAKKRNTKLRLMNLKPDEMIEVMRTKSQWIKH